VELVRHGYSRRVSAARSTAPLGNRNMSAQIEG
jgi:hypothetical protein